MRGDSIGGSMAYSCSLGGRPLVTCKKTRNAAVGGCKSCRSPLPEGRGSETLRVWGWLSTVRHSETRSSIGLRNLILGMALLAICFLSRPVHRTSISPMIDVQTRQSCRRAVCADGWRCSRQHRCIGRQRRDVSGGLDVCADAPENHGRSGQARAPAGALPGQHTSPRRPHRRQRSDGQVGRGDSLAGKYAQAFGGAAQSATRSRACR